MLSWYLIFTLNISLFINRQTQSKKTKEKEFTARILKHEEFVEKREREYADA